MAKLSQSSQMIRVSNEIIELIPELNRLAREGKPIADAIQRAIANLAQIDRTEPAEDDATPARDPASVDSPSAAPDPGLLEILAKLAQMEQKIDRLSQQPHRNAPAEILTTNQLIERLGISFGQLAAQARTSGQPLETALAQRTGFKYLGGGNFLKQ